MSTNGDVVVEKLYESEDFLIVNKPYDMYINSNDENEKNTVTYHVASPDSHLSTSANPIHFIQRLDYATSGVLCIAKNRLAAARGGQLLERRRARKYYLAVLRGRLRFGLADVEYRIGIDPTSAGCSHRMRAVCSADDAGCVGAGAGAGAGGGARRAHTRMLALEWGTYAGDPVTVVLLKPITGRRHQLRVHARAAGHAVAGDCSYGAPPDRAPHRMFLHAARLVLPFPQETIDVQTAEPFFSDARFSSQWRSERCLHKYRSREEFREVCDIIDKPYVIGVKYKMFKFPMVE